MGCGPSKLVSVAPLHPVRGVSFKSDSFKGDPLNVVHDTRDPERRRATLMAERQRANKYKSESWATPSARAPPELHRLSAQQPRADSAEQVSVACHSPRSQ